MNHNLPHCIHKFILIALFTKPFEPTYHNHNFLYPQKMLIALLFFTLLYQSKCAKILGMFPIASHSHQVVYQPVWRELSLRGHQVTVFTPNPLKNATLTNLTEIDMSSTYDIWRQDYIGEKLSKERFMAAAEYWMMTKIEEITEECFKKVQTMFEHTDFDLVIVESFDPLVYSLGCKFRVPFITISSCGVFLQTHDAVGNPTHPVLSPDLFVNVMEKFDLFKKIGSTVHDWWYRVFYYWYFLPRADKIAKRYWGRDCPYLGDLERNVSLILMNTNSLLHPVRPLLPNVVEMGKMHITSEKPLPRVSIKLNTNFTKVKIF